MSINFEEFVLYLAHVQAQTHGRDVAVLVQNNAISAVGVDTTAGQYDSCTAAINLMQNVERPADGAYVVTTYVPKQSCLGMATMAGFFRFVYATNAGLRHTTRAGSTWTEAALPAGTQDIAAFSIDNFHTNDAATRRLRANMWYGDVQAAAPNPGDPHYVRLVDCLNAYRTGHRDTFRRPVRSPTILMPEGGPAVAGRVDEAARHDLFMLMAFAIIGLSFTGNRFEGLAGGHNIGSVLRGPDDNVIGWGVNAGGGYGVTYHGEVNLIQNYHRTHGGAALPNGSILYTTLEPCHMCAGMIAESGQNMEVYFGQTDPGIDSTALKRRHNGSRQTLHAHPNVNIAAGFRGGSITSYLARPAAFDIFRSAMERYLDSRPGPGSALYPIWRAGVRILEHIEPNVINFRVI